MPGTFQVDVPATFATLLLMAAGPKNEFGTESQAVSKTGERKWSVQVAATWHAESGRRPVSEVLDITVTGGTDPGLSLQPGTAVELVNLRVGVSPPEQRDNGRGMRVVGGKAWYSATGVKAAGKSYAKSEQAA
ncbi:MAG: hypothetical protein ACLQDY_08365 [Streptosporangiaceae bacterium]